MGVRDATGRLVRRAAELLRTTRRVARESWREVRDQNVTFMAGSIAYHAFVSMLPLLLFLLVALSAVGTESFTAALAEITSPFLTPYARRLLAESVDVATARTGVSVVGAVTLLWGTSKIFRGLDVAFSKIYDSRVSKGLFAQFENAVVVFVALGVAVVAFLAAAATAAAFPDLPYPRLLNPLFLVAGLMVAFFPIYYVFPDVEVAPLEVLPGVVVAAVGWTALEAVFQQYVTVVARYEAVYGALGSAFLLLVWLYFGGLVLLVGGVVNAVLAGRTGDDHALHVTEAVSADSRSSADDAPAERTRGADRPDDEGERARLAAENRRLRAENRRLERRIDHLDRRSRRRSVWTRAKRWLFGE